MQREANGAEAPWQQFTTGLVFLEQRIQVEEKGKRYGCKVQNVRLRLPEGIGLF
ncbi:MAG: hypothetical protein ACP5JH_11240 [Bacteroidota bacterium]